MTILLNVKSKGGIRITYINHSCFLAELEQVILLFDYYSEGLEKDGIVPGVVLPAGEKPVYVFVSHKHKDHFDKTVFGLEQVCPRVTYIISKDAHMNEKYMGRTGILESAWNKIHYMGKNQKCEFDGLSVMTLASTDAGVAYLVTAGDKVLYHAGDLNWWSFGDETKEAAADMEKRFKREIEKLKGISIDVAFLPLDARLGERFYLGFDHFMRNTDTAFVCPMHFWGDSSVIYRLKGMEQSEPYRERIAELTVTGQSMQI